MSAARAAARNLSQLLDVPTKQLPAALLLALNLFCIILTYSVMKPVRGALVLSHLGTASMPSIWVWSSAALVVMVMAYSRLLEKLGRQKVILTMGLFFLITLAVLRMGLATHPAMAGALLYGWCEIFSVMMVEQYWSYANDIFDTGSAKKLYGFITAGATVGGMVGSLFAAWASSKVGTFNLVIVCEGLMVVILAVSFLLGRVVPDKGAEKRASKEPICIDKPEDAEEGWLSAFRAVAKSPYLLQLAAMVLVTQVVSNLIDYQFSGVLEAQHLPMDQQTAVLGRLFFWVGVAGLVGGLIVSTPLQVLLGLRTTLLSLPLGNAIMAAVSMAVPGLGPVYGLRLVDKSLNYSVNRSAKEILYIPLTRCEKYKAKAVIDMLAYRMSKAVGSMLIWPFAGWLAPRWFSGVNLVLLALQCALVLGVARQYERKAGKRA